MADNYLERQQELYKTRKAEWEKAKKYGKKPKHKPSIPPATGNLPEKAEDDFVKKP